MFEEYSYDAWGRLRDPSTHYIYEPGYEPDLFLGRGYTGHEHLKEYGLINMNARLYDPVVGRFLSPDPYVQNPENTQNYNRYSYALNNPLKYTDPSGEVIYTWDDLRGCYVTEYGDRADYSTVYNAMFQGGYFRDMGWARSDGTSYGFGYPAYVLGGDNGAKPGYTWVYTYTSLNMIRPGGTWTDGTVILGEPDVLGVTLKTQIQTPTMELMRRRELIYERDVAVRMGIEHLPLPGLKPVSIKQIFKGIKGLKNLIKPKKTFEIADGVRRAKAAQELGHSSIDAMDNSGKIFKVPIKDLYSPFKNSIDLSTPSNQLRYTRIYDALKAGEKLPPIYVNPGNSGISVFNINFIY